MTEKQNKRAVRLALLALAGLCTLAGLNMVQRAQAQAQVELKPGQMAPIGRVDERFQSFNVEMVEVTGGRFWAPYKPVASGPAAVADVPAAATPAGVDASRFRYRAPLNLSNPKLRRLAAALAPSYVRVSGTWANTTYFQDDELPALAKAPDGFGGVLTRTEWKGVLDFSSAVDAKLVTSFAIGAGVRDSKGVWTTDQAMRLLAYTKAQGGQIELAEYFNEPTFAAMGGAVKGYTAADYGRDFQIFVKLIRASTPGTRIVGPDSVGEGPGITHQMKPKPGEPAGQGLVIKPSLSTPEMVAAEGPGLDGFAYHFYGGVSQRCRAKGDFDADPATHALTADWLTETDEEAAFYKKLRDQLTPGLPIWLTETAEAACGGDPWARTFVDSFRYLHQLGALSEQGVQAVMHNTLAASDYALLDEATLAPRPDYWAALLWARLMGPVVLAPAAKPEPNLYVYAHCLRGSAGGVALLALNTDKSHAATLKLNARAKRYELATDDLLGEGVKLNGKALQLTAADELPKLEAAAVQAGEVHLAPATISFFAVDGANNPACR